MKNKIFIFLLLPALYINCSKDNSISIPNDITFQIQKGEKTFSNTEKAIKDSYFSFFKKNQIPLFRSLISKKYSIFVGIPFNTTVNQMCNNDLLKSNRLVFNNFNLRKCYKVSKDQNDNFLVEYIIKNKGQLYLLASTKDSLLLNSVLSQKTLDQRIILSK